MLVASTVVLCALVPAPPARSATPNDTLVSQQWSLRSTTFGAKSAWSWVTGGPVTVAVIDTGVAIHHPDLRANVWTNPGEIPGNGVDDDGDGLVDDVHGWNFAAGNGDVDDDNGHGTAVAGVIAARGNNRRGIAGIAWRARIMALKALDSEGDGTAEAVAQAVGYAVARGAQVINLSLATEVPNETLRIALQQASDAGVLIVVASGNMGRDIDAQPVYPASYTIPHMVVVAATDRAGRLMPDSDRGAAHVMLTAPGESIMTTTPGGRYQPYSGTSVAAPAVAGALVLLRAARPDASPDALLAALFGTARRTALAVTYGAVDVGAAVGRSGVLR